MRVDALWRYPVKSMLGERLHSARLEHRGVRGDRLFAIRDGDGKLGSGKNSRRFRRIDGLRYVRATLDERGEPRLTLPDGRIADLAALREFLGEPTITVQPEREIPHFDDQPLHVVSRQAIDELAAELNEITVDERRFRPNIVIDGVEDGWPGRRARIGPAVIEFVQPTERCVMVNAAEPGIERSGAVLKTLTRKQDMQFGMYARVVEPGDIAIEDTVTLL
jgi:MOSC domain-containing protein